MTKIYASLISLFLFLSVGAGAQAGEPDKANLAFVTYLQWDSQEYSAAMLVNSIRRWGGEYADCPIYVVLADPERTGFRLKDKNVNFVPLTLSDSVRKYPFAAKAFAAAKVEEMTAGKVGTLVWLDPETIILGPPKEYDLKKGFAAAVAPVTLINTGQAENEPVDAYWGPVYKRCSLDLKKIFAVETFVDCKKVRAWLNCGMFSVRPERGLFREWAKILEELLNDREYQRTAITDSIHRTFLHQAVISTLIVSRLERREIHMLPRGYNYPLFCHDLDFTTITGGIYKVPPHKKAKKLNDLTSVFIESLFAEHADWIKFVPPADEPLKTWLIQEYYDSLKVVDHIYREENSCNSYLITTDGGSVLVDPGGAAAPESALRQLSRRSPVQAILLTHAHHDHIGGISNWTKDKDIPVIGQREMAEFTNHNDRLRGFDNRRLSIQFGTPLPQRSDEKAATPIPATALFDKSHSLAWRGIHFEFFHTGGETPDQALIWISELKAVFIGDNYYTSFPNLSTLRGSPPRPALEYIKALEKALSFEPEVLLPGHGDPLLGKDNVRQKLTKYRDAIRYVHDATVQGMNEGKDVRTLAQEIALPRELELPQAFGRVSWAVMKTPLGSSLTLALVSAFFTFSMMTAQVTGEDQASLEKVVFEINNGHPADALKLSAALAAKNPRRPEVLSAHGLALLDCGEFIKAQALFEQAVKLDSDNPDAHLGLGELASGRLHLEEASGHLKKAVASSYFKLRAFQSYGKCLHDLNRHSEAKTVLERALTEVDQIPERDKTRIANSIKIYAALGNTRLYKIPDSFKTTSVGFSTYENNIIMPAELNGRESVKIQLDTGMPGGLAISQALADKMGLDVIGEEIGGNVAREYKTKVGVIDSLRLGDLVVRNVLVYSLPDPKFVGGSDGNLGLAIFKKMNMSIDYSQTKLFIFNRAESALQSGRMDPSKISEKIPFWNKSHILVFARINDMEPTPLIFDTGAGVPVLNLDYYLDHIDPKAQVPTPKEGQPKALPFTMKSLEIGGLTFTQVFSIALDLSFIFEIGKMNYPGIIGASVLQASIVHINFADSVMFIEKK